VGGHSVHDAMAAAPVTVEDGGCSVSFMGSSCAEVREGVLEWERMRRRAASKARARARARNPEAQAREAERQARSAATRIVRIARSAQTLPPTTKARVHTELARAATAATTSGAVPPGWATTPSLFAPPAALVGEREAQLASALETERQRAQELRDRLERIEEALAAADAARARLSERLDQAQRERDVSLEQGNALVARVVAQAEAQEEAAALVREREAQLASALETEQQRAHALAARLSAAQAEAHEEAAALALALEREREAQHASALETERQRAQELRERAERAEEELATADAARAQLFARLEQAQRERAVALNERNALAARVAAQAETQEEAATLARLRTAELERQIRITREAQTEQRTQSEAAAAARAIMVQRAAELHRAVEERDRALGVLEGVREELRAAMARADAAEREAEQLRSNVQRQTALALSTVLQRDRLQAENATLRSEVAEAVQEIERLRSENVALRAAQRKPSSSAVGRESLAAVELLHTQRNQFNAERRELESEADALQAQLNAAKAQLARDKIANMQRDVAELGLLARAERSATLEDALEQSYTVLLEALGANLALADALTQRFAAEGLEDAQEIEAVENILATVPVHWTALLDSAKTNATLQPIFARAQDRFLAERETALGGSSERAQEAEQRAAEESEGE